MLPGFARPFLGPLPILDHQRRRGITRAQYGFEQKCKKTMSLMAAWWWDMARDSVVRQKWWLLASVGCTIVCLPTYVNVTLVCLLTGVGFTLLRLLTGVGFTLVSLLTGVGFTLLSVLTGVRFTLV